MAETIEIKAIFRFLLFITISCDFSFFSLDFGLSTAFASSSKPLLSAILSSSVGASASNFQLSFSSNLTSDSLFSSAVSEETASSESFFSFSFSFITKLRSVK